jgi:hypothetical protein
MKKIIARKLLVYIIVNVFIFILTGLLIFFNPEGKVLIENLKWILSALLVNGVIFVSFNTVDKALMIAKEILKAKYRSSND